MQEGGEAIEIGERVDPPLDLYWPGHGRNPGVPHVRSHFTTRACGTREPGVASAARRSSSAMSLASASRDVLVCAYGGETAEDEVVDGHH